MKEPKYGTQEYRDKYFPVSIVRITVNKTCSPNYITKQVVHRSSDMRHAHSAIQDSLDILLEKHSNITPIWDEKKNVRLVHHEGFACGLICIKDLTKRKMENITKTDFYKELYRMV